MAEETDIKIQSGPCFICIPDADGRASWFGVTLISEGDNRRQFTISAVPSKEPPEMHQCCMDTSSIAFYDIKIIDADGKVSEFANTQAKHLGDALTLSSEWDETEQKRTEFLRLEFETVQVSDLMLGQS
jgi:hypothetical protein